jgi:hypothetical protein
MYNLHIPSSFFEDVQLFFDTKFTWNQVKSSHLLHNESLSKKMLFIYLINFLLAISSSMAMSLAPLFMTQTYG